MDNDKLIEETNRRLANIKRSLNETEQIGDCTNDELDKQTNKIHTIHNNLLDINDSQNNANTMIKKMLNKCRCIIF